MAREPFSILAGEARVPPQAILCGICGAQSGTGLGVPPSTLLRFSPASITPPALHTHSSPTLHGLSNWPISKIT